MTTLHQHGRSPQLYKTAVCKSAMRNKLSNLLIGNTGNSDVLGMAVIKCAKWLFVSLGVGCIQYIHKADGGAAYNFTPSLTTKGQPFDE